MRILVLRKGGRMTRLRGMTVAQMKELVEDMRKVYSFSDDKAKIVDTHDLMTNSNTLLELYVHDEKNDVDIRMSKGVDLSEY